MMTDSPNSPKIPGSSEPTRHTSDGFYPIGELIRQYMGLSPEQLQKAIEHADARKKQANKVNLEQLMRVLREEFHAGDTKDRPEIRSEIWRTEAKLNGINTTLPHE